MSPFLSRSILLVDDDEAFRGRLARAFERRGYRVAQASDVASALTCAERESFSAATVDLRMPGESGLELVERLLARNPAMRILILTGYGSIASAVEAVRKGAVNYLNKPADADEILTSLFTTSERTPSAASVEVEPPSLARLEWEHINRVLSECGGNISKAARLLGLHRRSLQRKLSKFPVAR